MTYSFLPITSWDDAASLVTVISLPLGLLTIAMGGAQIAHQLSDSRRRASFDVFIQFSERFREYMRVRSDLKDRFERGDRDLKYREIKEFYQLYWNLQINEWEMFRAGLLPVGIYASWLCYTHDSIVGEFQMGYFDGDDGRKSLSAANAFVQIALNQMMRSQTECRAFFVKLSQVPYSWMPAHSADADVAANLQARLSYIKTLLIHESRVYRKTRAWKLA